MENPLISDIQENEKVKSVFLVREMSRGETKAGKPYLSLTLMDSSGVIAARVWENADQLTEHCQPGAFILVDALSQSYKGTLQLRVDHLQETDVPENEMARFLPSSPIDIEKMAGEFIGLVKSIEDQDYKALALAFFSDRKILKSFKKAPAAKAMHHAYFGGLLEHTLGVTKLAANITTLYPAVDRSLLMAGATLHDIGKLTEFTYDVLPYDYSDRGRLVGHMVLGIEMIDEKIRGLPHFPEEKATHLKHLILSHHGRHEFGSPSLPMMLEAFVLNFLDDLDAKINYVGHLGAQTNSESYQWSEYQRNLERFLYVRNARNDHAETTGQPEDETDPRQRNLWLK